MKRKFLATFMSLTIIAGMTGCGATDSANVDQSVAGITAEQDASEKNTAQQASEDATVSEESTTSEPEMTTVYLLSKYTCYDANGSEIKRNFFNEDGASEGWGESEYIELEVTKERGEEIAEFLELEYY